MNVSFQVDEDRFQQLVVNRSHEVPVLVDIGADWCSPCLVLTPMLERLVAAYGGAFVLAKVDADENMRIAGQHRVRGFPTVIAYSRGREVDRFHSTQTEGFLRRFIDAIIDEHSGSAGLPATAPQPA